MVHGLLDSGGAGGGGSASDREGSPRQLDAQPFVLSGNVVFAPEYFPERIQVTKKRNISREENFCKGEDVVDQGPKNREIHIHGRLIGIELDAFDAVVDDGDTFTMTSTTWSGEVVVEQGDYEGPTGWHPPTGDLFWDYDLDLISTGKDEPGASGGNGIVSEGERSTDGSDKPGGRVE